MVIKIGINGFGRIGRIIFRAGLKKADVEITAINDPAIDMEYICYLIKFDSIHGKHCGSVTHTKDDITVDDSRIKVFHEKLPARVPWQAAGVDYVIEASGMFTSLDKASGHLSSVGVKRVIVASPSVDAPMIILGVNHDQMQAEAKVISCASSTMYCLAPLVQVLEDSFGLAEGCLTSIHAMTPSLKPVDGLCLRGNHWRDHRGVQQNIIPAATGACRALGRVLPRARDKLAGLALRVPVAAVSLLDLTVRCVTNIIPAATGACRALGRVLPRARDKLAGLALRVPVAAVSLLDLTVRLNCDTTLNEIFESIEKASNTVMKGIIRISREQAVSSDFIGETHSCVLDADSSIQLKPNFYKLICWYENEYSYACRVLDTIFFSEEQFLTQAVNVKENVETQDPFLKDFRKEVLSNASHVNKSQPRLMLKKLTSSQNLKESQKKCELSKIWNNDKEISRHIRQNRHSFFHCVAIRPQNQEEIECIKAHERLEMLKQEFTKMVNITESLLKRSCIGNAKLEQKLVNNKDTDHIQSDYVKEIEEKRKNSSTMFDTNKNQNSVISLKNNNQLIETKEEEYSSVKTTQEFQAHSSKKRNESFQNENVSKNKLAHDGITSTESICTHSKNNIAINRVSDEMTKTNEEDYDENEIDKDLEIKSCVLVNNVQSKTKTDSVKPIVRQTETAEQRRVEKETRIAESDSGFFSLFIKNSAAETQKDPVTKDINDVNKTEIDNSAHNNKNSQHLIRKEANGLSKEGIVLNDAKQDFTDSVQKTPAVTLSGLIKSILHSDIHKNVDLKTTADDFSAPERISTGSDLTYTSEYDGSPANMSASITVCTEVSNNIQDIYDKLGSISGTDSNNSFQMNERKSQVINITDLTTSLEDLNRLDKICQIIEISDELSNKLFSALENNTEDTSGSDIRKKKWSFKDLCERIKLDDFCEKVFGTSSRY